MNAMHRLVSGKTVDLCNFTRDDVALQDIAHGLSNLCRWGGQCAQFYSVAQHSVHVAECVLELTDSPLRAMRALFHDAAEAYLIDLPRPIKYLPQIRAPYIALEDRILAAVYDQFDLGRPGEDAIVNAVDEGFLTIEGQQLFNPPHIVDDKYHRITNWEITLAPMPPKKAWASFLSMWSSLDAGR